MGEARAEKERVGVAGTFGATHTGVPAEKGAAVGAYSVGGTGSIEPVGAAADKPACTSARLPAEKSARLCERPSRIPELLAPAGGMDALLAAVAAGADAVYVGLGAFNARAAAENFSPADLARSAVLAHAHGVRVYVALNTSVDDAELDAALDTARTAVDAGADALIVSDWGLGALLARELPGVELHLSTQANVHAVPGVLLAARELGFARATTSRELTVAELAALVRTGVEVEAFCHGAICVCYSGACELSQRLCGRSALKGLCAQPCRLPYRFVDGEGVEVASVEGDKLLCPRDYLSIRHIPELVRAGVASLKVEGRMKNPDYVYGVVRAYREALDAAAAGGEPDFDALEWRLGSLFNRSFTDGYLTGCVDAGLMSYERSNHQGVRVGHLAARVARSEYEVELEHPVGAGDVLEVRSCPDQRARVVRPKRWSMVEAPRDATASERLQVHIKRKVELGSAVHLVRDASLVEEAAAAVECLRGELAAAGEKGAPPEPCAAVPEAAVAEKGTMGAEAAMGRSASVDAACPRAASASQVSASGVLDARMGAPVTCAAAPVPASLAERSPAAPRIVFVAGEPSLAQWAFDGAGGLPVADVCVRSERLAEEPEAWDALLPRMGVLLGEACRASELDATRALMRRVAFAVCRNLTQVALAREEGVPFEVASPLTVCNAPAARLFAQLGARRVWASPEAIASSAAPLATCGVPLCWTAFTRPQLMVTEVCLLRAAGSCDGRCATCVRRTRPHFLQHASERRLRVRTDAAGRSRLFDTEPLDAIAEVSQLVRASGGFAVVDATEMGACEARKVVARLASSLAGGGEDGEAAHAL